MLFLLINILILFSKIFSNDLEKTDRREIGLNSLSDLGDVTLGIGIT